MNYAKQVTTVAVILPVLLLSACSSTTKTQPGVLSNLILEANNSHVAGQTDTKEPLPEYLSPYLVENQKSGLRDQVLMNMKAGIASLLHVPAQFDHPFRFNPITDFGLIRSLISDLSDQN